MNQLEKIFLGISLVAIMLFSPASTCQAGEYTVLTNILPPIKFEKDGKVQGVAGDTLIKVMEMAGESIETHDIQVVPWAQAYQNTLDNPDTICLAMAKTPQREKLFKWVGPIYTTKLGLIAKKARMIDLSGIEDAAEYTIGTVTDSAPEKLLIAKGIPAEDLVRSAKTEEAIHLLVENKIDLFSFAKTPVFYSMLQKRINPDDYQMVLELRTVDLFIAFNKATDDELIHKLQAALDELKTIGPNGRSEYDAIVGKYFTPFM